MDYDHPSQLKIMILQVFEDGEEHTSAEISEILGLEKEIARKQLSRYKDQNLLGYQERVDYDEERERPIRAYHYYITDRGKERLDWLRSAERLFQYLRVFTWKKATRRGLIIFSKIFEKAFKKENRKKECHLRRHTKNFINVKLQRK